MSKSIPGGVSAHAQVRSQDLSEAASAAAEDFFVQIYEFFELIITRFFKNGYASIAQMSGKRWTKVIGSVAAGSSTSSSGPISRNSSNGCMIIDRDRRKEKEKRDKERAQFGKVKMTANSLRPGADDNGKVLGEVENTDDELEDEEDIMAAKGPPNDRETRKTTESRAAVDVDCAPHPRKRCNCGMAVELASLRIHQRGRSCAIKGARVNFRRSLQPPSARFWIFMYRGATWG
ncbi:uncharacterized protein N7515_008346 [Penicillium bovifimosum]|uniref:Uncharacterized protein n=1 Tax=Penicillium bovifimosum TaxID=126998 RepID=A0A9W9GMS6_9EURO|nr:uncharacterized protein N7515_008346 [Penicillium bovifimosum]KAJ5124521.1 hypothetical protein N7515_008346 [Penicillium bovifimosum]